MKLFRRNQNKDVEKPIITYYVKYIGVLSSNKSYPLEEGADVHIYEDKVVELLKSKFKTTIPYKNMTDIQNVDAGKKADFLEKGIVGGLIWKRHAILTVIKYSDDDSKPQSIALDFMHNTKYGQPLIDKNSVRFKIHLLMLIPKWHCQLLTK
jgi:hypothetical protein